MPKKINEDSYIISETGNWNVASDYSKFKIMFPLRNADEYSKIAIFGTSSIVEDLINTKPIDVLRLDGLHRLIHELILLIDNTVFAIKSDSGRETLEKYRKQLESFLTLLPFLSKTITKNRGNNKITKIIPEKFDVVLKEVLLIKKGINSPLNKAHLIFTDKETFDPIAYKEKVFDRATTRG